MKISVVVPNLNYARFLPDCLSSIANQTHNDLEVILTDAGSTDGSQKIMENYANRSGWRYSLRPGESQIDSISWGLREASGEVQCWLNSDDMFLANNAIATVASMFESFYSMDCVSLGGYYIDQNAHFTHKIILQAHPLYRQTDFAMRLGAVQPATFWRKKVFMAIGFDPRLPYSFDSDFFVLACRKYNVIFDQNRVVAGYRVHDSNLSVGVKYRRVKELALLNRKHFGPGFRFLYLSFLSQLIRVCDLFPLSASAVMKKGIYAVNNCASYLAIYRIPSI